MYFYNYLSFIKNINNKPWGNEQYVLEVKQVLRSIPSGDVKIQQIDIAEYTKLKQLENKQ